MPNSGTFPCARLCCPWYARVAGGGGLKYILLQSLGDGCLQVRCGPRFRVRCSALVRTVYTTVVREGSLPPVLRTRVQRVHCSIVWQPPLQSGQISDKSSDTSRCTRHSEGFPHHSPTLHAKYKIEISCCPKLSCPRTPSKAGSPLFTQPGA